MFGSGNIRERKSKGKEFFFSFVWLCKSILYISFLQNLIFFLVLSLISFFVRI